MLKHYKNIQKPADAMKKVQALAWSPNGKKLAVANSDRVFVPLIIGYSFI